MSPSPSSFLLLIVALVACLCAPVHGGAQFLTFDASLIVGVDPYAIERVDNIGYELALLSLVGLPVSVDAMCLQGIFLPYQLSTLNDTLSPYLPYLYTSTPAPGTCFCNSSELTGLNTCYTTYCSSATGSEQMLCGFNCLTSSLSTMSVICQNCLTGKLNDLITGQTDFTTAIGECVAASSLGASGSDCLAFGGYSGNVLFSRKPLMNPATLDMTDVPNGFKTDAIYAHASYDGLDDVYMFCTQLLPVGPDLDYNTTLALEGINSLYQTGALEGLISTFNATEKLVLMGNFKQSPDLPADGVHPFIASAYAVWGGLGFTEPAATSPACTYCNSNSLTSSVYLNDTMSSHIFLRGFNDPNILSIDSQLALTGKTTILDVTTPAAGTAQSVPYSPNYGVLVQVSTAASSPASKLASPAWLSALRAAVAHLSIF